MCVSKPVVQYKPSMAKKDYNANNFVTQVLDNATYGMAKAPTCVNGSKQRLWTDKEDLASPTVLLELVMITSVIDAKEGCEVAIIDIPNAFVQTKMEGERVIMKMRGKLLESERTDVFHTIVAKGLFVAKHAQPNIMMTIAFLCTQV